MITRASDLPLFAKTLDFLGWLIPQANHFPRLHRHTITRRLLDAVLNFQERLFDANNVRGAARLERLSLAEAELDKVRLYLRLTHRLGWLTAGQYEHAARLVAELGRLLGAWRIITQRAAGLQTPSPVGTG